MVLALAIVLLINPSAFAWNNHHGITLRIIRAMPKTSFERLDRLARQAGFPGASALAGPAVDEPDGGMDQNLDASLDPPGDRKYMGGEKGPNSQGFRHMYFAGWQIQSPLVTFQFPPRALGQAPLRVQKTAELAKKLLQKPATFGEGMKQLSWALHYLEDLGNPYHSSQIPTLRMVPWQALWTWPPQKAFEDLVSQSSRVISNYHRAFENYIEVRMNYAFTELPDCLKHPTRHSKTAAAYTGGLPQELALRLNSDSRALAPALGRASINLFGEWLKLRDIDLAEGRGKINYEDLARRPDLNSQRMDLEKTACIALANTSAASVRLILWAFEE